MKEVSVINIGNSGFKDDTFSWRLSTQNVACQKLSDKSDEDRTYIQVSCLSFTRIRKERTCKSWLCKCHNKIMIKITSHGATNGVIRQLKNDR